MRMNVEQLNNIIEKIKLYKVDEDIVFNDIKDILNNINCNYDTDNKVKIENLEFELMEKMKLINQFHNNNIMIMEKNILDYIQINKDVSDKFSNLI